MTTFLAILCLVLIIYIIGAMCTFAKVISTIELDNNHILSGVLALVGVMFACAAALFWPVAVVIYVLEFFSNDSDNK